MANEEQVILKVSASLERLVAAIERSNSATTSMQRNMQNTRSGFQRTNLSLENFNKKTREGGILAEALDGNWFQFGRKLILNTGPLGKTIALMGGLGYKIRGAFSEAFGLSQQLSGMADGLTFLNSAGNSTNLAFQAFGSSKGGFSQVTSALRALDQAGISDSKTLKELSGTYASLEQATGVAADTFSKFGGEMVHLFGATAKEAEGATSAFTAMGFTSGQLQETLEGANTALEKFGSLSRRSAKDAKEFSQGYAKGVKVLTQFGISAKKANEFIGKILDPDQFQENVKLFGQLGISTDKYFAALESGKGAGEFIGDAIGGLADLGTRLQGMNAQARFNMAKTLGLDPQLLSSLAGKSSAEVKRRLQEAQKAAQKENDAKEKEAAAKANAERIEMQFTMMKAKALGPIIKFIEKNQKTFFKIYDAFAGVMANIYGIFTKTIQPFVSESGGIINSMIAFFDRLSSAKGFKDMIEIIAETFSNMVQTVGPILLDGVTEFVRSIGDNAKTIIDPIIKALKRNLPIISEGLIAIVVELANVLLEVIPDVLVAGFTIAGNFFIEMIKQLPRILFKTIMGLFKKGFAGVVGGLFAIGLILRKVVKTYIDISAALRGFNKAARGGGPFGKLGNQFGGRLKGLAGGVVPPNPMAMIRSGFNPMTLFGGIGSAFRGIIGIFTNFGRTITRLGGSVVRLGGGFLRFSGILLLAYAAVKGFMKMFDDEFVGAMTGKSQEELQKSGTKIQDRLTGFVGGFIDAITFGLLPQELVGAVSQFTMLMFKFFTPFGWILQVVDNFYSNIDYWAVQLQLIFTKIANWFKSLTIFQWFNDRIIQPVTDGFKQLSDFFASIDIFSMFFPGQKDYREIFNAGDRASALKQLQNSGIDKNSEEYKLVLARIDDKFNKAKEEDDKKKREEKELKKDQMDTNKLSREANKKYLKEGEGGTSITLNNSFKTRSIVTEFTGV